MTHRSTTVLARRWRTALVAAGVVVTLGQWVAWPADAQMGGGGRLTVEVRPRAGPPRTVAGSPIRIRGASFDENGRPVEIRWDAEDGAVLATAAVDARGDFFRTVRVPVDATVGPHLVYATQTRIDDSVVPSGLVSVDVVATEAEATVAGPPPEQDEGGRPWPLVAGVGAAAVLAAGLGVSRKRRRARSPEA